MSQIVLDFEYSPDDDAALREKLDSFGLDYSVNGEGEDFVELTIFGSREDIVTFLYHGYADDDDHADDLEGLIED